METHRFFYSNVDYAQIEQRIMAAYPGLKNWHKLPPIKADFDSSKWAHKDWWGRPLKKPKNPTLKELKEPKESKEPKEVYIAGRPVELAPMESFNVELAWPTRLAKPVIDLYLTAYYEKQLKKCNCDSMALFNFGCQCGGV